MTGRITVTAAIASNFGGAVAEGRVAFQDMTDLRVLGWTDATRPSLTIDGLSAGRHLIRADYSGDSSLLPLIVHEVNHRYLDNLDSIEGVKLTMFHGLNQMGYEGGDLGYDRLVVTPKAKMKE